MCGEVYKGHGNFDSLPPIDSTEDVRRQLQAMLETIDEISKSIEEDEGMLAETEREMAQWKGDLKWQEMLTRHAQEIRESIERSKGIREKFDNLVLQTSSMLERLPGKN